MSFPTTKRNGVKPWQFDPTKWLIWTLSKIGLPKKLRRVPADTIVRAELAASSDRNKGPTSPVPDRSAANEPAACDVSPLQSIQR